MKVLNVNPLLETSIGGGTAERTIQMSYYLNREGVECSILTTDYGLKDETRKYLVGVNILALPILMKRFLIPYPHFLKVNKLVRETDVIHLMNHWGFFNIWIYFLACIYKKKYVVCPAGAQRIYGRSKFIKRFFNFIIGERIIKNASACIAVTKDEIKDFQDYNVAENRVAVIPNGIEEVDKISEGMEEFIDRYNLNQKKSILFVGRLNSIKGIDFLVDAFCELEKELEDYCLIIAGPDEGMKAGLLEKIKQAKLDGKVHFLGFINRKDKKSAYQTADLLVIPSRQEAMSIVVLEAGVVGTPVVLTNECGLNEFGDMGIGNVVDPTVEGIKKGIRQHLRKNKDVLDREKKNLEQYVKKNYLWVNIVKKYVELYSRIL